MNTRRITLIVAVFLAIGTGILTLRYLSSVQQSQATQTPMQLVPVVIASRDIPARAKITPDMLTTVKKPSTPGEQQAIQAIGNANDAVGDIALISLPAGTTITQTNVGKPAEVGLAVRLKPGMRAVTIPVDHVKDVSGLIEPGDHVDVLASVQRGAEMSPHTYAIIRDALVLAMDSDLESTGATPPPDAPGANTVTLGISPSQSDLLTTADLNTTLRLALRSPNEPARSLPPEELIFPPQSVPAPAPANVPPPARPAPAPAVAQVRPPGVTVIDGDRIISGDL
ncbi:MAG: Flp pilus assembly protein CpaB [Vulcanimicrobiaceae bacterium]